jgi:N-acyl-D-amino-acid deacylase
VHTHILFKKARVVDGTGAAPRLSDLAVTDDRIVAIGDLADWTADRVIPCEGKVLAPGFIDAHTHYDDAVLSAPLMESAISQGVTTVINGNCGFSIAPLTVAGPLPEPLASMLDPKWPRFTRFKDYVETMRREPAAVNSACLIGHSTLRINHLDDLNRAATPAEVEAMRAQLNEALEDGAIGLSTGAFYPAARACTTEELIGVSKDLASHGVLYVTHMRDEGDRVIEAMRETFAVGREAGCGVHISHHKCAGLANHGLSTTTLAMIDEAMTVQDVGLDTTPYIASSTILNSGRHRQAERVIITWSGPYPEMTGRDLADVAKEWGLDLDATVERLLPAGGIFFIMAEDDVQRILAHEHTLICSDSLTTGGHPHPRVWGTFPRVLGRYVRELGLLTLEEAVAKMTGMTAERFGLTDRGILAEGKFADLVLFDPETVADAATFAHPIQPAHGIDLVFVNGRTVWAEGAPTGARPGLPLTRV